VDEMDSVVDYTSLERKMAKQRTLYQPSNGAAIGTRDSFCGITDQAIHA